MVNTDYILAVTEATPPALNDLKRVLYLANHFGIPHSIVINKYDLETSFAKKIELFAKKNNIPIIGKIPYRKDFVDATIKMIPVEKINPDYKKILEEISENILSFI